MSFSQETLYAIALTRISYFNTATCLQLYRKLGSATAIMENRNNIKDVISDASPRLINALSDVSEALHRAEAELEFDNAHAIRPLTMACDDYPERMRNCDDAPIVLFYRGNADLNQRRIVSVVGTRHCTAYGQDIINNFCQSLKELCPDVLIVSGLAYGVDICAHRNALKNGFDTVGVLAHGLDMLYPSAHRDTAKEMLSHGGLLTEFLTNTNPDKMNFVRRNRIVAGISDATIVVESAARGGSLITADIAQSYARDVFTFPAVESAAWVPARTLLTVVEAHAYLVLAFLQIRRRIHAEGVVAVRPVTSQLAVDVHVRVSHRAVKLQHGGLWQTLYVDGRLIVAATNPRQSARASRLLRLLRLAVLHDSHILQVPLLVERSVYSPVVRYCHRLVVDAVA